MNRKERIDYIREKLNGSAQDAELVLSQLEAAGLVRPCNYDDLAEFVCHLGQVDLEAVLADARAGRVAELWAYDCYNHLSSYAGNPAALRELGRQMEKVGFDVTFRALEVAR